MQRYMCSRFFIDYKSLPEQIHAITQYVATHFLPLTCISHLYLSSNPNEIFQHHFYVRNQIIQSNYDSKEIHQYDSTNIRLCLLFFEHLSQIIQENTVCLTRDDKKLLISNIYYLQHTYHVQYEYLFCGDCEHFQKYHSFNPFYSSRTNSSSNSSRSVCR